MSDLEYEVVRRVAWIRLNRPAQKNAFTLDMIEHWARSLELAKQNPEVGAIVVTGNGGNFCSGVDLSVMDAYTDERHALSWKRLLTEHIHHIALALERIDKPVIAAVHGVAVGAGMDMALMCDMRFVGTSVRFCEGYIRIGAVPGDGGAYFLPRIVGTAKALELLLSGEFVGADESLRIGLANRVHPDETLHDETQTFAEKLCAYSPVALRTIKRAVYQSRDADLRTSLDMISSHMGVIETTDDAAEALRAFKENRKPVFRDR